MWFYFLFYPTLKNGEATTSQKNIMYRNLLITILMAVLAPFIPAQSSEAFQKAFAEVARTTPAEQSLKIDQVKAGLSEREILTLRVAFDGNAKEDDIHIFLKELSAEIHAPTNPWGINTPGGLESAFIPQNIHIKAANNSRTLNSWYNLTKFDTKNWPKNKRQTDLFLRPTYKLVADGTIKIVSKRDLEEESSSPPSGFTVDRSLVNFPQEVGFFRYTHKTWKALPHDPICLVSLGNGDKRAGWTGVQDGNLLYGAWDSTPKPTKEEATSIMLQILDEVIIPAGSANGSWELPSLEAVVKFSVDKYKPSALTTDTPVAVADPTVDPAPIGAAATSETAPTANDSAPAESNAQTTASPASTSANSNDGTSQPASIPEQTKEEPRRGTLKESISKWFPLAVTIAVLGLVTVIFLEKRKRKPDSSTSSEIAPVHTPEVEPKPLPVEEPVGLS
jgi:hypothetical protein